MARKIEIPSFFSHFQKEQSFAINIDEQEDISFRTLDNLGYNDELDKEFDELNPLSGPFLLKNAIRGDLIEVTIKNIHITRDIGLSSCGILPKYLKKNNALPILGEEVVFWKVEDKACTPFICEKITNQSIKLTPSIGCIRCSGDENDKIISSLECDEYGGNLDFIKLNENAKIYLPVLTNNAWFYIGDVHAAQSEAEIGGSGIEVSAEVTLSVSVVKNGLSKKIHLLENNNIHFFGFGNNLSHSLKSAFDEALYCLRKKNGNDALSRLLISQSAKINVIKLESPVIVSISLEQSLYFK